MKPMTLLSYVFEMDAIIIHIIRDTIYMKTDLRYILKRVEKFNLVVLSCL